MREQIFHCLDTDVPDAPEDCVICGASLDPEGTGTITGYDGDGCTCSAPCHAKYLRARAEDGAAEQHDDGDTMHTEIHDDMPRSWPKPALTRADLPRFLAEAARLVEPVAARCVGAREFLSARDQFADHRRGGVRLYDSGEFIVALLPEGLRAARVTIRDDGGWSAEEFQRVEDEPRVASVSGNAVLWALHEAMRGIPMREHAWRRQRVARLVLEWNENTSPAIDMIRGVRL